MAIFNLHKKKVLYLDNHAYPYLAMLKINFASLAFFFLFKTLKLPKHFCMSNIKWHEGVDEFS